MLRMTEQREELLRRDFWTLQDLADFIGVRRQRIYALISTDPDRFPQHYKRRGLWESPPAPLVLRPPQNVRSGKLLDYIEWHESLGDPYGALTREEVPA